MKTKLLFVVFLLLGSCFATQVFAQNNQQEKKKGKETVTFQVDGLFCKNCQAKVEKNIAFEKGVTDLQCDLANKTVTITYKTDKTDPEKLAKAFEKIGMKAVPI